MITPVEAAVPYSAAADGPFTTSMDSISSGLMSLIRLGFVPPIPMLEELLSAVMRVPAATDSGSFVGGRLLVPRIPARAPADGRFPAGAPPPRAFGRSTSPLFQMGAFA